MYFFKPTGFPGLYKERKVALTLGFLYPNHAAEDDYLRMADLAVPLVDVEVVHTTISEDAHQLDAIREAGAMHRLRVGAEVLRKKNIDSAMWACTCASFIFGLEGAKQQAAAIGEVVRVPTSSTSLAFVDALHTLGVERVSIAATYPEEIGQLFKRFLAEAGVTVVHLGSCGILAAADVGFLGKEDTIQMIRESDRTEAEAILVPDTALHTAGYVDEIQRAVDGKAVLTANQVTMWKALRLAGVERPQARAGLGSLFS
jgi:maleate cis-trans isomerase